MIAEVQTHLHSWIPTTNHQNSLPSVHISAFIRTCMHYWPAKLSPPFNLRHHRLCILSGGHYQPSAQILRCLGFHAPKPKRVVVLCTRHRLVEPWPYIEPLRVCLQVFYKLLLSWVSREILRERHQREFAELLREMEAESIVGI